MTKENLEKFYEFDDEFLNELKKNLSIRFDEMIRCNNDNFKNTLNKIYLEKNIAFSKTLYRNIIQDGCDENNDENDDENDDENNGNKWDKKYIRAKKYNLKK